MDEGKNTGGEPEDLGSLKDRAEPREQAGTHAEFEESRRRRRRRNIWIAVIAGVILALWLVHHFSSEGSSAGNKAAGAGAKGRGQQGGAAITAGQSKTGDINIYVDALGTVTPTYTVTVYSQITGRVMAVHYREGQMVHKGASLIDIDPRPSQATLTQAEGTLQRDQGVLAQARIDLERYKAAAARNAIAKQQLDDQEQAVVQAAGTVKADEGTVAYDRIQLAYCHIVAPITGRVGLRLVDPGNTIFSGSSSTLVVITQLQPMTVVFNVSEDDLSQIQAQLNSGHKLEVDAFDRAKDKLIESGKLQSVDNQVDTTTGTVKFRAEFPNKNQALFPNQFVNARLLVNTLHNATLVPSAAVQHNGTAAFVYIVNPNNTVTVQPVNTLTSNEQVTAVEGVNPGVTLATSGFDRLENGSPVIAQGQTPNQKQPNPKSSQSQGGDTSPGGHSAP
jgi:membrane fusion protein, multidrug efflux system